MQEENEIWKDIKGYEGLYQVSNLGNVKSLSREFFNGKKSVKKEKILKLIKDGNGRLQVGLSKNGKVKIYQVHRLVIENFISECPEGMECAHNDGNHLNNKLENLRWDSHKNNMNDRVKHGTSNKGEKSGMSKLTENNVKEILKLLKTKNYTQTEIAKMYNISCNQISFIKNKKTWKHINLE